MSGTVMDPGDQLTPAVLYGHVGTVKQLLRSGWSVNHRAADGRTPLILAVRNGDVKMMRLLLSHGADVNLRGRDGLTALQCTYGASDLEQALRAAGATR